MWSVGCASALPLGCYTYSTHELFLYFYCKKILFLFLFSQLICFFLKLTAFLFSPIITLGNKPPLPQDDYFRYFIRQFIEGFLGMIFLVWFIGFIIYQILNSKQNWDQGFLRTKRSAKKCENCWKHIASFLAKINEAKIQNANIFVKCLMYPSCS